MHIRAHFLRSLHGESGYDSTVFRGHVVRTFQGVTVRPETPGSGYWKDISSQQGKLPAEFTRKVHRYTLRGSVPYNFRCFSGLFIDQEDPETFIDCRTCGNARVFVGESASLLRLRCLHRDIIRDEVTATEHDEMLCSEVEVRAEQLFEQYLAEQRALPWAKNDPAFRSIVSQIYLFFS